jgi:hypothetical protein
MIKKGASLIVELHKTFNSLDRYNIKLNSTKCAFGVPAG